MDRACSGSGSLFRGLKAGSSGAILCYKIHRRPVQRRGFSTGTRGSTIETIRLLGVTASAQDLPCWTSHDVCVQVLSLSSYDGRYRVPSDKGRGTQSRPCVKFDNAAGARAVSVWDEAKRNGHFNKRNLGWTQATGRRQLEGQVSEIEWDDGVCLLRTQYITVHIFYTPSRYRECARRPPYNLPNQ